MDAAFLAIAMRGLTATLFLVLGVLLAPRTTKNQEPTRAREVPGSSFDNIRRAAALRLPAPAGSQSLSRAYVPDFFLQRDPTSEAVALLRYSMTFIDGGEEASERLKSNSPLPD